MEAFVSHSPGDAGLTDPRARRELSKLAGWRALDLSIPFADGVVVQRSAAHLLRNRDDFRSTIGGGSAGSERVPGGA